MQPLFSDYNQVKLRHRFVIRYLHLRRDEQEDKTMTKIVTAIYASEETLVNVRDDLVSTGIPQEKIRINKEKRQVQVMSPDVTESEIIEIMNRHEPTQLDT